MGGRNGRLPEGQPAVVMRGVVWPPTASMWMGRVLYDGAPFKRALDRRPARPFQGNGLVACDCVDARVHGLLAAAKHLSGDSLADKVDECGLSPWMTRTCMSTHPMTHDSTGGANRTDRSLLRRVRRGEEDAATALYVRYARRLQAVAKARTSTALAARFDPEDVVQSVFRTFFRRASEGQYDVPEGEELWNLLLVISLNKIRAMAAFHRAAKRDVAATVAMTPDDAHASVAEGRFDALQTLELVIDELLAELPAAQQAMIRLRIEGRGVAEIADATRRSKRSVERVLQQFRSQLGHLLFEEPQGDASPS